MVKETNDFILLDFTGLFKAVLKRLWIIVLCVAIGAGVGAAYSTTIKIAPMYRSTAKLYITGSYTSTLSSSAITAGQAVMSSYFNIVESHPVIDKVRENLGLTLTYSQVKNCISEKLIPGTCMATVELTFPDPEWAQAILDELISLSAIRAYDIMGMAPPMVIEDPSLPVNPYNIESKLKRYTVYGAAAGAAVSMLIVLILVIMDNKLHNPKNVEWKTGLQTKGIAPKAKKGTTSPYAKKAMRYLYSELWAGEKEPKVISFVANADSDKKDLIDTFSGFMSDLGKEIVILDTNMLAARTNSDVSRPDNGEDGEEIENKYLEDYLNGETQNVDDIILYKGNVAYIRNSKEVYNSYELLKSENCKNLFSALRDKFDCVVVDTVSFENANDAEAVLDKADANIAVFTCDKTKNKQAAALTERYGANNLSGAVLTNVKIKKSKGFKKIYGKYIGLTAGKEKKK